MLLLASEPTIRKNLNRPTILVSVIGKQVCKPTYLDLCITSSIVRTSRWINFDISVVNARQRSTKIIDTDNIQTH